MCSRFPRRVFTPGYISGGFCGCAGGAGFQEFDELRVGLDAVGPSGGEGVVGDGLLADAEVFGDLGVGPAFDEPVEDFVAPAGGAVLRGL